VRSNGGVNWFADEDVEDGPGGGARGTGEEPCAAVENAVDEAGDEAVEVASGCCELVIAVGDTDCPVPGKPRLEADVAGGT
jgi:hypothetical protein